MPEIYLLEQLSAFARCGTLSAAAEELHLSQSALSRSMQRLEAELEVKLFERQKNRITLNENGRLAAEYADRLLAEEQDMIARVRAFDRSRRTISLGSCAPIPNAELVQLLSQHFADMTISSEVQDDAALLRGLHADVYDLTVLHQAPTDPELHWTECGSEKLFLTVPPAHPLADYEGLHLSDLAGQSLLLYSRIGFWYRLCVEKIPNPRFLLQTDMDVFNELVGASALPSFATDVTMAAAEPSNGRIAIPILDPEAEATYYCVCKAADRSRFAAVFRHFAR